MRIILLGPPGAGKGTIAGMLKEKHEMMHISTGDILREEMKSGSYLGKRVKGYVDSGGLVPDEVIIEIIQGKLTAGADAAKSYLLDGFPRTVKQAESLDAILKKIRQPLDYVIYMDAGLPVIIERLTGRRICRNCGAIYHLKNRAPRVSGKCDECGGEIYQRADDNEDTIRNRMDVYMNSTRPIIEYYEKQKKLYRLDSNQNAEEMFQKLNEILNEGQSSDQDQISKRT